MLELVHHLAGRPWAIRADIAAQVHGLIAREGFAGLRQFAGMKSAVHAFDEERSERMAARRGMRAQGGGGVAVIPIIGTMTQRGDVIGSAETRSSAAAAEEVLAAAADPKVDAVVIEIDSPGGEVYGVPELWQAIRRSAAVKPVVVSINSVGASAALYAASAGTEVWITPSGEMGSLGVYALHVDVSKALDDMGEKPEFIVADDSPFKVEGNPYEPLSDDARAQLKKSVNRYMQMFVRDVARGRGVSVDYVRQNFGQGRMLGPQDAMAVKMADKVGTLEQAVARAAQLGQEQRQQANGPRASVVVPDLAMEDPEPEPEPYEPAPVEVKAAAPATTPEQDAAIARRRVL
jgi:signal peptide peptidase SppA